MFSPSSKSKPTGTGASGTWGISITGNAATATTATNQSGGTVNATTGTFSGLVTGATATNTSIASANDAGSFSVRGNSTYPAVMSFHRTGVYAVNFGLSTSNVMELGGWSAGGIKHSWDFSGNYTAVGNVTAYSDARVKENVKTIDNALEKVCGIRGVTFDRTDEDLKNQMGVIAQEVLEVLPEVVNYNEEKDRYTVAYGNMVGVLIEAIKELKAEIDELKGAN